MDKLNDILEIIQTELRFIEQDSEYNKAVYDTLLHVIGIIKAHIEE